MIVNVLLLYKKREIFELIQIKMKQFSWEGIFKQDIYISSVFNG